MRARPSKKRTKYGVVTAPLGDRMPGEAGAGCARIRSWRAAVLKVWQTELKLAD